MEKICYFLILLSGIRLVWLSVEKFATLFFEYREFINEGFQPEEMDCTCETCLEMTKDMTMNELLAHKRDKYNTIRKSLLSDAVDKFFYFIFYLSVTILATINYL